MEAERRMPVYSLFKNKKTKQNKIKNKKPQTNKNKKTPKTNKQQDKALPIIISISKSK